jgi:hypothetical protein
MIELYLTPAGRLDRSDNLILSLCANSNKAHRGVKQRLLRDALSHTLEHECDWCTGDHNRHKAREDDVTRGATRGCGVDNEQALGRVGAQGGADREVMAGDLAIRKMFCQRLAQR